MSQKSPNPQKAHLPFIINTSPKKNHHHRGYAINTFLLISDRDSK